jgi:16S rRNA (cytosine1402-N4)-methyltransferase
VQHVPVLLGPAIAGLNLKRDGCYIDGTFGRGGHSGAILKGLGPAGRLLAIDRDPAALAAAPDALKDDPRLELIKGEFAEIGRYAEERNLLGKVDGVLLDVGVSSPQLDDAGRGFSFQSDGPLDMRMDPEQRPSAAEWIAAVDEKSLRYVIRKLGEEPQAGRIAKAIVAARRLAPLERTAELAAVIENAVGRRERKRHPATRTFQAIRIFINRELEQLDRALAASVDVLRPGGRLCVISFHSLEDRIVKRFIRDASREPEQYRGLPDVPPEFRPRFRAVGKAVEPTADEIAANPRARSARLRIAERL